MMTPLFLANLSDTTANASQRSSSLFELLLASIGIGFLWLWSAKNNQVLKSLGLSRSLLLERARQRAALSAYQIALGGCVLMSMTLDPLYSRLIAMATVIAPFLHAWLDPERSGFLHHRQLRHLVIVLHFAFAGSLCFFSPTPALVPLSMAALVFHRYQRRTLRHFGEALVAQNALSQRLQEQMTTAKLAQTLAIASSPNSALHRSTTTGSPDQLKKTA